ncbi:UDP-glucose/GDP-mannose dehydrogenase family protein [bacterium]|nr:UDP-glucose/GDP-mannose dehydrogenase family protein [bacterium]
MKVGIIGTGYVGLVAGVCFADKGNHVICVDNVQEKIESLRNAKVPFYEPGVNELLSKNIERGTLEFSMDIKYAVQNSDVIFIAVGTPSREDGSPELKYVLAVANQIGESLNGYKIIINKSTAPVGTLDKIRATIKEKTTHNFDVASNPEWLEEGRALDTFIYSSRVVIGTDNQEVAETLSKLYEPFVDDQRPIIVMSIRSAEMTKYVANTFLAVKLSFINEMANLSELLGANIDSVRKGIGFDPRIGNLYLAPGIGYGGSCLPKDVKGIIHTAQMKGYNLELTNAVHQVNELQKLMLFKKIHEYYSGDLRDKKIAVWGLSFKPETDDMREAPSIAYINEFLNYDVEIKAYDPEAAENAKQIFGDSIEYFPDKYQAVQDADVLVISTEWKEFKEADLDKVKQMMKKPLIFDGRNLFAPQKMRDMGFEYFCIGYRENG